MRLLVLGGSWFLGRAIVEQALHHGHTVTTFNRGRSGSDVPGAEPIRGDRTRPADLAALVARGGWDTVIDTSGMTPELVESATAALSGTVDRYVFVSTVNVYTGWPTDPLTDDSPVRQYTPLGPPGESDADAYGREKAGCEKAVVDVFGERAALLRPGVIVGPHEYVGRFPWWLRRIAAGGRVLTPGTPTWPIQPVDVRDVAAFALTVSEQRLAGSFNVTAPIGHSSFGAFLAACQQVTGSAAELEWVDDEFLAEHGVGMWTELPLWRRFAGTWHVDAARARAAGLVCRPLPETVADTWAWLTSDGQLVASERAAELGITPEREAAVLTAWDARKPLRERANR